MMKLVLAYYDNSVVALDKGVNVEALVNLAVREPIGRFKYVANDALSENYEKIQKELATELGNLTAKEDR